MKPESRRDQEHARILTEAQRKLLLDIRKEHPSASSKLIIRTLENLSRLSRATLKPGTLNHLYADHNLRRRRRKDSAPKERLRWRADGPNRLWHADVCHGPGLIDPGKKTPVRIHGILDDDSRDVLALKALSTEREVESYKQLKRHGLTLCSQLTPHLDEEVVKRGRRIATTFIHLQK